MKQSTWNNQHCNSLVIFTIICDHDVDIIWKSINWIFSDTKFIRNCEIRSLMYIFFVSIPFHLNTVADNCSMTIGKRVIKCTEIKNIPNKSQSRGNNFKKSKNVSYFWQIFTVFYTSPYILMLFQVVVTLSTIVLSFRVWILLIFRYLANFWRRFILLRIF